MNFQLKTQAIRLRRMGLSYSEILGKVPVAKSTLSSWLHSVGLSKTQKQRLTEKKLASARKGALVKKMQRLRTTEEIKRKARLSIRRIVKRDLWLMGIVLYWAEGTKEKEYKPGQGVVFSNSDPLMIKLFLKWLDSCVCIDAGAIDFGLYIHENHKDKVVEFKKYWSEITGFPRVKFDKIYFKKHKIKSIRKNRGENYHGLLRIAVRKSSNLNRRIAGWIEGICFQCRVV